MTREIGGFTIGPYNTNSIIAQRLADPQHEYVFGITAEGVELHLTAPHPIAGDPLKDAKRFVTQASEAAKEYRDLLLRAAAK